MSVRRVYGVLYKLAENVLMYQVVECRKSHCPVRKVKLWADARPSLGIIVQVRIVQ